MPFNGSGAATGAASGAAAGSAFGPWGTVIGGVAGGVMGGFSGGKPANAEAPTLGAPRNPGAVSGTYGGSYVDPVTGRVVYASNTNTPSLQSYQDQNTYNQLMGYGGGQSDLQTQISYQQQAIDRLKAQGPGSAKVSDYLSPEWIGSDGKPLDYTKYLGIESAKDNPLWASFMANTGGKYGSNLAGESFAKWAKDTYNKHIAPALANYENAQKTIRGNSAVYDQQVSDAQRQLDQLKNTQATVYGSNGAAPSSNPMLSYLEHGPNQANYISQQVTDQYNNAMRTSDQQNAMRGMGSSSMSELAHAQGANQLSQGILGAQVTGAQNNYNDRLKMLQFLQGNKGQEQGNQVATGGIYNQQMGLGQGLTQNIAGQQTQQQAGQLGLNMNANQANINSQLASNAALQNSLTSAAGVAGNAYGTYNSNQMMQNWLAGQNAVNGTPGAAGTAYGNWMGQNAGMVPYAGNGRTQ